MTFNSVLAGVVLSVGALLGLASAASAITYTGVDVRIQDGDTAVYDGTVYVSSEGCTVEADGTEYEIAGANALCAVHAAAADGGFEYALTYYESFDSFLLSSVGETVGDWTNYWSFAVDHQLSMVGLKDHELTEGEKILLTYGGWPNTPLRLTLSKTQRSTDRTVSALVEMYSDADYAFVGVEGATVTVGEATYTTDANGMVEFEFSSTGEYAVVASMDAYTTSATETVSVYKKRSQVENIGRKRRAKLAERGVAYLQSQMDDDGLVSGSQAVTEWAAMALVSAGETSSKMFNAVKAYNPTAEDGTTELARHIMALEAIDVDSRSYKGRNYVKRMNNTIVNGQYGDEGYCNDDIFAALALISADAAWESEHLSNAVTKTLECVNTDGGIGFAVGGSSDVDTTAAWMMLAARVKPHHSQMTVDIDALKAARKGAIAYIASSQNPDGGWGYYPTSVSNASSTSWMLMAVRARRHAAHSALKNNRNGFHFLNTVHTTGSVDDAGAFAYDADGTYSLETLNTAYAVMAVSLPTRPLPVNKPRKLKR